jgi:hypothetical protein
MDGLIDEVRKSDHGQGKGGEKVVTSGGKETRDGVPDEQCRHARKGDDAEDDRKDPVGPVKTFVHKSLSTGARKEVVRVLWRGEAA